MGDADWAQLWNHAETLLAREAMETQVALVLAAGLIFIMFFEGVWAVFRLPRRAIFSLFRRSRASRFEEAAASLGGSSILAAYAPRFSQGFVAGSKARLGPEQTVRNRKRVKRTNRRPFKATKPVIRHDTRIDPGWFMAAPEPQEEGGLAPFHRPNAV